MLGNPYSFCKNATVVADHTQGATPARGAGNARDARDANDVNRAFFAIYAIIKNDIYIGFHSYETY